MRKHATFGFRFSSLRPPKENGVALILTLAIIALVTLMLIAFVTSMRVENTGSKNFNDLVKTRELALGAIDQAVSQIRLATVLWTNTTPSGGIATYVTFPGLAYTNNDGAIASVSLCSDPTLSEKTNLNDGFWITGSNSVEFSDPVASAMKVGWLYVAEDGTVGAEPLTGHGSLVGRFAYWVDDEASKVNINTAAVRPNPSVAADTYGYGAPSEVDLTMLLAGLNGSAVISAIQARQATTGFTTIEEVKLADTAPAAPSTADSDFNTNRFYLTAYSDDENDVDVFDRPRLDLFQLNTAKDITDTTGPNSAYARLSDNALTKVYGSSRAFATKYPVVGTFDGLKQIIANMIAYRLNPRTPTDLTQLPDAGGDPPAYLGLAKAPYVNEVKVQYDTTISGTTTTITRNVTIELLYLYAQADGSTYVTGSADTFDVSNLPTLGSLPTTLPTFTLPVAVTLNSTTPYYTFQLAPTRYIPSPNFPTTVPASTVTVNYKRSGTRINCAQVPLSLALLTPTASAWQGAEVNDPCMNAHTSEWTPYRSPNPGTLMASPPGLSTPTVSANTGVYLPPETPPSKAIIRGAQMKSVGELGYIHGPTSWTYLHLQPQSAAEKALKLIPDWAVLDLFTVGTANVPTPTIGRININSSVTPLATATRLRPLEALLNGVASSPATLAQNIYGGIYANPPDAYGNANAFDTIGEICEVSGMDNGGATDAAKEAIIRRIANLITVRSNTFTIWVLAQTIKDVDKNGQYNPPINPPSGVAGNDFITGEVRAQAVVERYESPQGSPPKYRTKYIRYLYN